MPVAPIEGVHRKERREDVERLYPVDLVLAQELAVHQHSTPICLAVLLLGYGNRREQEVACGFAIRMGEDLIALGKSPIYGLEDLVIGGRGIAGIVGPVVGGRLI